VLTRDAVVVRRGVPRVAPGEVLPAPAPFAIAMSGRLGFMAIGIRSRTPLSAADLTAIWPEGAVMGSKALAVAQGRAGGALTVGLVRSRKNHDVQRLALPAER
jgi:hypothetical protein